MRLFLRTLGRKDEALFGEYMQTGFAVYAQITGLLGRLGRRLGDVNHLLDFASGYGRVGRFLVKDLPPQRITVADVYPDAVAFQQDRFGVCGLVSETDPDAVDLGGPYDLITCISLFTHLPEPLFGRWLVQLSGALTPDGLLLFTTQAPSLHQPSWTQDFTFVPASESRSLDTAVYGSTFVSKHFVEELVREQLQGQKILAALPQSLNNHQDLYVLGPADAGDVGSFDLTLPLTYLDGLSREQESVRFWGWGVQAHDNTPVAWVRAYVNDKLVCEIQPEVERPDVIERHGAGVLHSGFEGRFRWRQEMSHGVFAVEVEDQRGLLARIFNRMPF